MHFEGLIIGLFSFFTIGLFHPLVIKVEYYFGRKCCWVFGFVGIAFLICSIITGDLLFSVAAGVLGFTCLWSIREIFEQRERVQRGLFPLNPNRKGKLTVRPETTKDYKSVWRVNETAFAQPDEAFLVEKLRKNPLFNAKLSLVATIDEIVIGYILFIPIEIIDKNGDRYPSLALSPVAVLPDFQGKGIGGKLIRKGIEAARAENYKSIIVLGHADYYPKFGFKKASDFDIHCPYPGVPDECFMALELVTDSLKDITATVKYPKEFDIFG